MTERGMIFNAEMVRAILDGRKTQTRRIMNEQPVLNGNFYEVFGSAWSKGMTSIPAVPGHSLSTRCPFGAVGDRIWVRETARCEWQRGDFKDAAFETGVTYKADGERQSFRSAEQHKTFPRRSHAANGDLAWHPSIHMPRWASRILLEITDVRVERLNAISQEDAQAEGMELTGWRPTYSDPDSGGKVMTPYDNFAELWSSIYGDESWKANPWVWVISFKRVEGGAA
ncbi:morphogenetic protein [Klebsiella quasipneumoniae subsp. quasipneumoniae]|uniref:morphogenetic protein n=1 Tax=Klebsiella quasipneumoniae TaxID=1463165 RepID=UPI003006421B